MWSDRRPGEDWRLEEGCDPGPPEAGEAEEARQTLVTWRQMGSSGDAGGSDIIGEIWGPSEITLNPRLVIQSIYQSTVNILNEKQTNNEKLDLRYNYVKLQVLSRKKVCF